MRNALVLLLAIVAGCASSETEPEAVGGKADSSALATFWNMEWDGEVLADRGYVEQHTAALPLQMQLFYTVGILNEHKSVGRIDKVAITNVNIEPTVFGMLRITYHASLPVAWHGGGATPEAVLTFPRFGDAEGLGEFAKHYRAKCVDKGHSRPDQIAGLDATMFWYFYRPGRCLPGGDSFRANGAQPIFTPEEIITRTPVFTPSVAQARNTYPEYHKVWEDNALNVVAIFGKAAADGDDTDQGVVEYNNFFEAAKTAAQRFGQTTISPVAARPGLAQPLITISSQAADGRQLRLTLMMTGNVATSLGSPGEFAATYERETSAADAIIYNGHAGFGANVRAMAKAGAWRRGQYVIVFENGCNTYAYIDSSLAKAHAALNPDDPTGTKYVDELANAMPAFFEDMAAASWLLVEALLNRERPKSYEEIMRGISSSQVVLVTGDEDNVFRPGM